MRDVEAMHLRIEGRTKEHGGNGIRVACPFRGCRVSASICFACEHCVGIGLEPDLQSFVACAEPRVAGSETYRSA